MKKKSKILLFLKLPPPITGATLMNRYLYESKVLAEKFDIQVISICYKSKIEDTSIFSFRKIRTILILYFKLIKSLTKFNPQFVYFQISPLGVAFFRDCIYVFILKIFRIHIVYHIHGKGIKEYISGSKLKELIYKWAFKSSSVICLAESLTSDIFPIYLQQPFIVNNAIPLIKNFVYSRRVNKYLVHILFLSNLIISKGIYVFLDAISLIDKKFSGLISASIVGSEVEISGIELNDEINKRNLNHCVKFMGPKYGNEKNEIYSNTDILIYPTCNDVWGLVILEAMQFGIPVIASKEGAIPEIVDDGVTGFLVDKHRPDQIAEKLEILINDPDLRRRMGETCRKKFLRKYTLETFESNMKKVFEDVLSKIK